MAGTAHDDPSPASEASESDSATTIQSVALTFRVIREMASAEAPIGVSELARRMGELKPRVHRHLITLRSLGILAQDPKTDLYRLGWGLVELGQAALLQYDVITLADTHMRQLRDELGLTVGLLLPSGDGMVVGHTVESERMVSVTVRKGLKVPMHGSAGGRIMLAFESATKIRSVVARAEAGPKRRRIPSAGDLETIKGRRYEYSVGETQLGINSLAAPILDSDDRLVAVTVVFGTHVDIIDPPKREMVQAVQRCAAAVSKGLGSDSYDKFH